MAQTNLNQTKLNHCFVHQPHRDFLLAGVLNVNMSKKNVYSAATNVSTLSMSTAGDFAIDGKLYNKAASSAVWLLTAANCLNQATISTGRAAKFILCLNAAGSGVAVQSDLATSAAVSSLGYSAALDAISHPDVPATYCPISIMKVAAGNADHVPGSSTWSLLASAAGSAVLTDIMTLNTVS